MRHFMRLGHRKWSLDGSSYDKWSYAALVFFYSVMVLCELREVCGHKYFC